jgi:fructose-bisphosphate aldolase class II
MFDGSGLPYRENIEKTREVVELCHPEGISVEAELGAVGGSEDGKLVGEADPDLFTDPDLVAEFVAETGTDSLAVAIGNVHGHYKGVPRLDFARLNLINQKACVPLVLHGGSEIPEADFRQAISLGISKVNVFTSMAQAAVGATKARLQQLGEGYHDYPELLTQVQQAVRLVVEEHVEMFGSCGKALTTGQAVQ